MTTNVTIGSVFLCQTKSTACSIAISSPARYCAGRVWPGCPKLLVEQVWQQANEEGGRQLPSVLVIPDPHESNHAMKTNLFAIAVLAGTAVLAAQPAMAKPHSPRMTCAKLTPAQMDSKFAEVNAAWATKNPDRVTALFDDDAVLLATLAGTPRTNADGIRDYFVEFLQKSPVATIDSSTIKSGCNWALRAGSWTVQLTDKATGAKSAVKARYTFLYQYEQGTWKIEHLHSSVMPASP